MSRFTEVLIVEKMFGELWRAEREFTYYIGEDSDGESITIKKGYISDGASIPRFAWSIVGHPMGEYAQGSFVHDKLYGTLGLTGKYTRKECDKIFVDTMKVLKVKKWKRKIMYRALRIGGWKGWNRRRRELEESTKKNS